MGNANTFEKIMKEKEEKEKDKPKFGEYPHYSATRECQRCYIGNYTASSKCYHCGN